MSGIILLKRPVLGPVDRSSLWQWRRYGAGFVELYCRVLFQVASFHDTAMHATPPRLLPHAEMPGFLVPL
jgi:hypothetical protein